MNMGTNNTAPAKPATDEDEVTKLFRRIYAVHDRQEHYSAACVEARQAKRISGETFFDEAERHATDEYFALQDVLPFLKATTATGAAIQIDQVLALLAGIHDDLEEAQLTKFDQRFRAAKRLLFSALDVVDELAAVKLRDIHPDAWSPNLNPWIPVEQRLEMVRAAR